MVYAPDDQDNRPTDPKPPDPVRVIVAYVPEVGFRRVFVAGADGTRIDISGSVERIKGFDINPRGPSSITLELNADLVELDWEFQTVGVLGDPMAALDRQSIQAVIGHAMAGAGFAESAEVAATTAVLEHLRGQFARKS